MGEPRESDLEIWEIWAGSRLRPLYNDQSGPATVRIQSSNKLAEPYKFATIKSINLNNLNR